MFGSMLFGLMAITLVWGQQYPIPPTCYTKLLNMGMDITQRAAKVKNDYETRLCHIHLPDLRIDVHNSCVVPLMSSYQSQLNTMRDRRCGYTRYVRTLMSIINQFNVIISEKCHGELAFTTDDCAALQGNRG